MNPSGVKATGTRDAEAIAWLDDAAPDVQLLGIKRLARDAREERAVHVARQLLLEEGDGSSSLNQVELLEALARYSGSEHERVARAAIDTLARFVRANLDRAE